MPLCLKSPSVEAMSLGVLRSDPPSNPGGGRRVGGCRFACSGLRGLGVQQLSQEGEQKVRSRALLEHQWGAGCEDHDPGAGGEEAASLSPTHLPTNLFCQLLGKPQTAPRDTSRIMGSC